MQIKNCSIVDYSISYDKNNKFSAILDQNKHLLPLFKKASIKFQLINSNEAFCQCY
jgi:hypothetical protein